MSGRHPWLTLGLAVLAFAVLGFGLLNCGGTDHFYPRSTTTAVAAVDLNGDGRLDLVSANAAFGGPSFVTVRLQDPAQSGGFQAPIRSAAGINPASLAAGSLGAGARPSLVVVNQQAAPMPGAANSVSVLQPDGSRPGAFLAPVALPVGTRNPMDAALGDLTGQGMVAVAVAADGGSDLLLFVQDATPGTFKAPVSLPVGGVPTATAMADLDGDGLLDLVVATTGNLVSVLLQDPANPGSFLPHVDYPVGSHPVSLKLAALAGSGLPDIVTANFGTDLVPTTLGLSVLAHDPAHPGGFLPAVTSDAGDYGSTCVAVGDLNGDGLLDIAVANYGLLDTPGSVSVFLQDPAHPGAFLAPTLYPGIVGPGSVAIGDLNGDGLADLAIADGDVVVRHQLAGQPGVFGPPVAYRQ